MGWDRQNRCLLALQRLIGAGLIWFTRLVVKMGNQVLQKVAYLALSTAQVRTKSQDPWVLCMPPYPLPSSQLQDEGSLRKSRVCIGTWKRSAVCQPFSVYLPFSQTFWWQVSMFCVFPSLLHSLNWSRYTTQRNKVLATYRAKCFTACWQRVKAQVGEGEWYTRGCGMLLEDRKNGRMWDFKHRLSRGPGGQVKAYVNIRRGPSLAREPKPQSTHQLNLNWLILSK